MSTEKPPTGVRISRKRVAILVSACVLLASAGSQRELGNDRELGGGRRAMDGPDQLSVSKLSSFGTFPASYQLGFGAYPVHPETGPSWKIRAAIVLLLPRAKG